jgi:predicted phage terminase large subunit-like protein
MSLRHFIEKAWPILTPEEPFIGGRHIDAISEHLEGVSKGYISDLVINIPPRYMKSFQTNVFWPAWEWGPCNQPYRKYIFASYAESLSTRDSVRCRRLIKSEWYQKRWGDRFAIRSDQDAKTKFENDKGGHRIATSVGGSNTGEGGDRIVVDDAHKVNEAESDLVRGEVILWWDETMSTRSDNETSSARVIMGQRVHSLDLPGHVIEEEHGYTHLCLPARFETKEMRKNVSAGSPYKNPETGVVFEDWRTEVGEVLWPERFPIEALDKREKRMTPYAIAGQHQQRPSPRGGGLFEIDKIIVKTAMPPGKKIIKSVRYWDKAGTEAGGCNTAGVRMHLMDDGLTVVIDDVQYGQWGLKKRNNRILQTTVIDGLACKVWHEQEPGSSGKESAQITNNMLAGYMVQADRVTGSKENRAEAYSIAVSNGLVIILKAPWNREFLIEHEKFPNGTFKDIVDSSSGAYNKLVLDRGRAGAL